VNEMSNEKILTIINRINAYVEAHESVSEKTSDRDALEAIGILIAEEILDNWESLYIKLKVAMLADEE